MKKLIFFTLAAMSLLFFLCGCDQNKPLQDGTYVARWGSFDAHGWREYVIITVADGKPTDVVFDAENELGEKKSEDTAYQTAMELVTGTYPAKAYKELAEAYLQSGGTGDMTPITGATRSSERFVVLADALKKQMQDGNTDELWYYPD